MFDALLADYCAVAEASHPEGDAYVILSQFFNHLPIAAYIKSVQVDGSLRMTWVNEAYEREIGSMPAEFTSAFDAATLNTDKLVKSDDDEVIRTSRAVSVSERTQNRTSGLITEWVGWKWPVVVKGKVIAVCGYVFPVEVSRADG